MKTNHNARKKLPLKAMLLSAAALCALSIPLFMNAQDSSSEKTATATTPAGKTEKATLGGGCFWCVEAVFQMRDGVTSVTSGYAGGTTPDPTYKEICSGTTGHAEVVQVEYDPAKITFDDLLELFWAAHDPTTLNRQGADRGTQYRSIILYHDETQKETAEKSKHQAASRYEDPLVTQIVPLTKFYPAEDYHQDYFDNNRNAPYCAAVIQPKLRKLEKENKINRR